MLDIPTGVICMWSGAILDIPEGWTLCDGAAGAPDLRNRFIVGAGDTYAVDATGGSNTHNHDLTTDGHFHTLGAGPLLGSGANFDNVTDIKTDTATTDTKSNLPQYYALAFIMKT